MNEKNTLLSDDSLIEAWGDPEQLPDRTQWLQEERSEAARAQYAFLLLKRQYARAGLTPKSEDVPTSWFGWSWLFFVNTHEFVEHGTHAAMLRDLLTGLVNYTEALSEIFFASNLLEMVEPFIDRDPPRSKFLPLLPTKALDTMDEMYQILSDRHEAELERMNAMYY